MREAFEKMKNMTLCDNMVTIKSTMKEADVAQMEALGKIDRKLFEKYRRRFSPYCSVASLYLWAVAGGAIPEMRDYKPKTAR